MIKCKKVSLKTQMRINQTRTLMIKRRRRNLEKGKQRLKRKISKKKKLRRSEAIAPEFTDLFDTDYSVI